MDARDSFLSDALLRELMAVGQVDVLVGVPTLDNAATVGEVVRAVQGAFARHFPRERTLLFNSDGGSSDGTPEIVRSLGPADADTVLASHVLRTMHRISVPYHGLPGRATALRVVFAAADLLQARAVAVLDPDAQGVTPERIAALLTPAARERLDLIVPVYPRAPDDGLLVSQLVRPFVRAAYGYRLSEPLAVEFACSGRFAAHCGGLDAWDADVARDGVDLWLKTTGLAGDFRVAEVNLKRLETTTRSRPAVPDILAQVVGTLFGCLEAHADTWRGRAGSERLPTLGDAPAATPSAHAPEGRDASDALRRALRDLDPLLAKVLEPATRAALHQAAATQPLRFEDGLWVATVYEFAAGWHRRAMRRDHLIRALAPLYLCRAAAFLNELASLSSPAAGASRLETLGLEYERAKAGLVERWTHSE